VVLPDIRTAGNPARLKPMPLGRGTWDGDRQVKAMSWCQLPEGCRVMSGRGRITDPDGLGRIAAPDSAGSAEELEKLVSGQTRLSQEIDANVPRFTTPCRGMTATRPSRFRYTA
jgi:hypothetical protein